jgi:hypothetical protein
MWSDGKIAVEVEVEVEVEAGAAHVPPLSVDL